jgi:hypothetical protein
MAIEGAKIDSAAHPTTRAEHIEPWRAGEQPGPSTWQVWPRRLIGVVIIEVPIF